MSEAKTEEEAKKTSPPTIQQLQKAISDLIRLGAVTGGELLGIPIRLTQIFAKGLVAFAVTVEEELRAAIRERRKGE